MDYKNLVAEDQRLAVLRLLAEDPHYSHNDSVLQTALGAIGHAISRDAVRSLLAWLAEQDLIAVEVVGESIHVATLTTRGLDVAQGNTVAPGIKRPSPKS